MLPEAFACDAERRSRFNREAQILASINHPNIGAIYGLEEAVISGDPATAGAGRAVQALVLELVEGPTLADLLTPRSAAARRRAGLLRVRSLTRSRPRTSTGIVHRDLKPANIKMRPDGTVKVLDFGLAKALSGDGSGTVATPLPHSADDHESGDDHRWRNHPGTAAYMSPEQAAGKAVDKRSDLWAFGVVLLEMLTGRPGVYRRDGGDTCWRRC